MSKGLVYALLGILLMAAIFTWAGEDVFDALATVSLTGILLYVVITGALTTISAVRWGMLTNLAAGKTLCNYRTYYLYFIISRAFGELFLPQSMSDFIVRPALVRFNQHTSLLQVMGGALLDRMIDILILTAALLPSALFIFADVKPLYFWGLLLFLLAGLFILLVIISLRYVKRSGQWVVGCSEWMSKRHNSMVQRAGIKLAQIGRELTLFEGKPRQLQLVFFLSLARFVLIGLQFYALVWVTDVDITLTQVMAGVPGAQLATILAITPGAIGFREGGFAGAFSLMGVSTEAIKIFVPLQRVMIALSIIILVLFSVVVGAVIAFASKNTMGQRRDHDVV